MSMPTAGMDDASLEAIVVGCVLIDSQAISVIADLIAPNHFFVREHAIIYIEILKLYKENNPIDLVTVTRAVQKNKEAIPPLFEGNIPFYLAQLANRVGSTANLEYYARLLIQQYLKKQLAQIAKETAYTVEDDNVDIFDLIQETEAQLTDMLASVTKKNSASLADVLSGAISQVEINAQKVNGVSGVPTGIETVDALTGGWRPQELIIIAARPAMGKTAFALTIARNAAFVHGERVAFFSLEMGQAELGIRLLAMESGVHAERLNKGDILEHEWESLSYHAAKISKAKIYIDDAPSLSTLDLRARCNRLKKSKDISLVIVDYLQLMSDGGKSRGNREQEIAAISRSLKVMAKELNVPVIALAQLNRDVEKRPNKRPQLSDLRESGGIEQDANMVGFLYRPDYYGITEDEQGESTIGKTELIIAKNRRGPNGIANMSFNGRLTKFEEYKPYIPLF